MHNNKRNWKEKFLSWASCSRVDYKEKTAMHSQNIFYAFLMYMIFHYYKQFSFLMYYFSSEVKKSDFE